MEHAEEETRFDGKKEVLIYADNQMIIEGNEAWCSVGPFCFIISYRNDGSYHYLDGKLLLGI